MCAASAATWQVSITGALECPPRIFTDFILEARASSGATCRPWLEQGARNSRGIVASFGPIEREIVVEKSLCGSDVVEQTGRVET
jgi:hypothetical protein